MQAGIRYLDQVSEELPLTNYFSWTQWAWGLLAIFKNGLRGHPEILPHQSSIPSYLEPPESHITQNNDGLFLSFHIVHSFHILLFRGEGGMD